MRLLTFDISHHFFCGSGALLLGSMYAWSWLIQLNMSYKYNENIACTGISILYPYLETGGST